VGKKQSDLAFTDIAAVTAAGRVFIKLPAKLKTLNKYIAPQRHIQQRLCSFPLHRKA
jgi:hypothetical protein